MPKLAVTEGTGKRVPILARVTPTVREGLEVAAGESGRSLSLEIETRLQASFDQDEIKSEMRGTIAALEKRIALMEERERDLWPDAEARALGIAFARTFTAARHVSGQDWREDLSTSVIVAGAMRRLMDRCVRNGESLFAALAIDGARVAAAADSIAEMIGPSLDRAMPALAEPALNVMQWTGRLYLETEFRDAATGAVLETVTGPECHAAEPEQRPSLGDGYRAALARFAPIREKVDVETFTAYVMKDGTTMRVSLDRTPAGPAPKAADPALHLAGQEEATRLTAGQRRHLDVLPPELGDRALFDETMGPPRPERDVPSPSAEPEPAPAPRKRGRPRKVPA